MAQSSAVAGTAVSVCWGLMSAITMWSHFFLLPKALGEAHRFSAWRGLAAIVLPYVLMVSLALGLSAVL